MHWANNFVGLPFAERGRGPEAFDCLGLLIEVQSRVFGRVIRDPACSFADGLRPENRAVLEDQVIEAATPQEGDALLFREAGRALHVGIVVDQNLMLHSYHAAAAVERWTGPIWFPKLAGIYRFV